ncbi:MAG: RNase adapter RapZ [Pseudohongiella sp.]|nr:RNase adapter RapZ [Pseudohongiella sp.]MDO9520839.1 RNase adapter RapZ [Pseudohongiella sp.]MDP2128098.1 RNase adapter RapZ [Pseudohongiella sp.]
MRLLIISGRSGSGKSTALNMLEDHGYYCIDNLPASLLPAFVKRISSETLELPRVAVSIDARNIPEDLKKVPQIIADLQSSPLHTEIIFLDASSPTLIKRFSESRRKHPLTTETVGLREAIIKERELLEPIAALAGLSVDTSTMSVHQLRDAIRTRVLEKKDFSLALMFESFGFKSGVPIDADFVFDARCLPNPYWSPVLRPLTGMDPEVVEFLSKQDDVIALQNDIAEFLEKWLPRFEASNRSYMTVAIGCTGGQHRSVYLCEQLKKVFAGKITNVQVLHRELTKQEKLPES